MYGGASSKLGRAAPKRLHSSFPLPPPPHRPSAPAGRLSLGASNRNAARGAPAAVEETFNLVAGSNPLAFSMIIRLAPDLVEEIKRVEAQGGTARMKFDPNPNHPNGNIIDVGGKEFRFTWSREFGDLCDIYEERQSGEDGSGLLVESGCAWRKLNVQRILDESTKNHVKMRSEEAERKLKSRKAIVLEPGNPSMKSQIKALAAVEATPWKNYNKKKEAALKKRKVETLQVGGPPKSSHRSGLTSTSTTIKGRQSSPLPSPPDPFAASSSPLGAVNMSKSFEDALPSQMTGKQDTNAVSEKEIPTRTNNAMRNTPGGKGNSGSKPIDLQGMLISLLKDKPNGMTLKALEKAVGDTLPNSIKKIEPIIKKIAKYQAPGRYILKPGMDLENSKKPQTESGSSPDDNRSQIPAREEFHDQTSAPQGGCEEKVPNDDLEEMVQVKSKVEEESNTLEKVDAQHTSPEGQAGSSSDSGSDSDSESDSSDSGSDSGSHSRSRSRSPAGTGSGSSSDSESDASSSSKEGLEGSDEDVDIMTSDDEKEPKPKPEASDQRMTLQVPVKSPEIDEKQNGNESDAVEIEKDIPEEQEAEMALPMATISNRSGKYAEETQPFSLDYQQLQERQNYIGSLFDERENEVKDSSRHEQSDSSYRLSKGKCRRGSDVRSTDERSERTKRSKAGKLTHEPFSPGMDVQTFENSRSLSPFEFTEDTCKGPQMQMLNRADKQGNSSVGLQKGFNQAFPGKSSSDLPQKNQRSLDQTHPGNPSYPLEKSVKKGESVRHGKKHSRKGFHAREVYSVQKDKSHKDALNADIHATDKKVPRNSRDGTDGSKQSLSMDSYYQKQGEMVGKLKEGQQGVQSQLGTSPKDKNRFGLDKSLQRELSDLELGEFRESTPDETHMAKQFEQKDSFKRLEIKANMSEDRNSDITKVKPSSKATSDSGKQSSVFVNSGFPSNSESANKKNSDNHFEDSTRSRSRVMQTHSQHLKADHAEVGAQNKLAEMSGKFRNNESGVSQDIDLEGRSESNRRASANASKQDSRRGMASYPVKESKRQTPNSVEEMADGGKDSVFADRNISDQKKRESSSDENSCSYSKYEKDEPELRGPIKTYSQYKEYVQEYRDKYDSYLSLHKILDGYRDEFQKLGDEFKCAKGDRCNEIVEQIRESYRRCGPRHKRLKKIFVVLHHELENIKQRIKDFAEWYTKE
ncbi:dentin sialophosphoprotein [Abrus precatorius]|uniref:Dentin sialophosphoprotein n=1 Tax=Abrus precatorius TaxID=3816 RepID=A0A8B8JS69_ABRPR|nr:dentin sialophosphoprotein [Abrus precatorius]